MYTVTWKWNASGSACSCIATSDAVIVAENSSVCRFAGSAPAITRISA
jgi:hypothetical protein